MAEEISKKALLVLVIIAVVVSIFSTTLVMNAVYQQTGTTVEPGNYVAGATLSVPATQSAGASLIVVDRDDSIGGQK